MRVGPQTANIAPIKSTHNIPESTTKIIQNYSDIFTGIGLLKGVEVKLHIDPNAIPIQHPIRRIPFHTREKVSQEIDRLLKLNIIEPVTGPTTWLNPIVPVIKPSGKLRLCLDMRRANETITRERHVIPKMEDTP